MNLLNLNIPSDKINQNDFYLLLLNALEQASRIQDIPTAFVSEIDKKIKSILTIENPKLLDWYQNIAIDERLSLLEENFLSIQQLITTDQIKERKNIIIKEKSPWGKELTKIRLQSKYLEIIRLKIEQR